MNNSETIKIMFEGGTSVTGAEAKCNFTQDLPKNAISLAFYVKIFQGYGGVFLGLILCKNRVWQRDQVSDDKGGYCDITLQKSRFKRLKLKNVSHS